MEISYAEGTTIQLQDAERDLDARLSTVESNPLLKAEDLAVDLASGIKQEIDPLTDRVKALEDEIVLLRAALEPKS